MFVHTQLLLVDGVALLNTPETAETLRYNDVIMNAMACKITSITIVYSTV